MGRARFGARWLSAQLHQRLGTLRGRRLWVAFSGGADSLALLAGLAEIRQRAGLELYAVHVNHQWQPDAGRWARQARALARALGVRCQVRTVQVRPERGASLEAVARTRRYEALARQFRAGDVLLTAHHQEDQLETMLLALMRGSGPRGLAAMPAQMPWQGGQLVRPLLGLRREELEAYCRRRALQWIEDPSNADPRYDRNFLRHRVVPALRERWPSAAASAARSAAHCAEAEAMLDALSEPAWGAARDGDALSVPVLRRYALAVRRRILRCWLRASGVAPPGAARLDQIAQAVLAARSDAHPVVRWPGGGVQREGARLLLLLPAPAAPARSAAPALNWHWRRQPRCPLPDGAELRLIRSRHGKIRLDALPDTLQIRARRPGERVREQVGSRAVKDLLQSAAVPAWRRDAVPLLCDGTRVLAVADLWLAPECRAGAGVRAARAHLRWALPARKPVRP